jgi:RNA polymerase sigma-70 factor (ECF subfamily)
MAAEPPDLAGRLSCPANFARFFAENNAPVFRALLAQHMDREAAEDATAEGFARAFMNWDSVAQHPNPRAWVIRTARNAYLSWRRSWDDRRLQVHLPELATPPPDLSADPSIIKAIQGLPERQREVLVFYALGGLAPKEIAQMLEVPTGTVSSRLCRARSTLRNILGETLRQEDHDA